MIERAVGRAGPAGFLDALDSHVTVDVDDYQHAMVHSVPHEHVAVLGL